jgi:uncharacterized protein YndB with AHSA1/START domain
MNDIKAKPGAGFEFVIRREFDAPLDRVWRAWTEPERMAKWWGPRDFDIVSLKLDLRPAALVTTCSGRPTATTCGAS